MELEPNTAGIAMLTGWYDLVAANSGGLGLATYNERLPKDSGQQLINVAYTIHQPAGLLDEYTSPIVSTVSVLAAQAHSCSHGLVDRNAISAVTAPGCFCITE